MKRIVGVVLSLMLVFLLIAGCIPSTDAPKTNEPTQGSEAEKKSDELYIGVYCNANHTYFYDHKIGLAAAGEMLGVQTKFTGPADNDINAMITAFEQAIVEKPAGIVVFGAEDTLQPVIDKAVDMGIPVVTVDGDVPTSKRVSFVGTGNYEAGYLGGTKLGESLGGTGRVAILTEPDVPLHRDRYQGYEDALKELYPSIEIVQIGDTKGTVDEAAKVTAAILQAYPDIDGIACTDGSSSGIAAAAKEAGLEGKIKIVAMDRENPILEMIQKGTVYGTIVQKTALMPVMALEILYNINHSGLEITSNNEAAGISLAPLIVDTGVTFVTADTAEFYIREN